MKKIEGRFAWSFAKRFCLIWGLSLICFSSFATRYKTGYLGCENFEVEEKAYQERGDESIDVSLAYGLCLLAKGGVTHNQGLVAQGMHILHDLADDKSNVVANYFIAEFYRTEGTFAETSYKNLDLTIDYYSRTLAIIKTYNPYPPNLADLYWEQNNNMELHSYLGMPDIYLTMFYRGVYGDWFLRVMNSDSYEGSRDKNTYPKYRENIMAYIDLAIEHAGNCKVLPQKGYFNGFSTYYKEICAMYEEKARALKELQWERHVLLSQERCKDVGSDEVIQANCPELDTLNEELISTYKSTIEEFKRIIKPIEDQLM